ncbi:acyltransferase family protein [Streptomyces phytohabitans]|uniref:acyltransferase family protein n=1 Tax=Streptomyces phytohabitans TaxID=1150371 RepID=UPI00345C1511
MASDTLTQARVTAEKGSAAAGSRDPFLDNAKFLLVVLVVMGHSWGPLEDRIRVMKAAYLVVYAFHMPAFVLLCGHLARSFTGRPDQVRKLLTGVLLPYLVFETVYAGMYTVVWHQPFSITPTEPRYLTWFLLALFLWRLTVPLWRALRHPVPVAVLVSLGAGLTSMGYDLALPRVLMFLPWFVLGMSLRREHFAPLRTPVARWIAVPVLLCACLGAYWAAPRTSGGWLLMQWSGPDMGVPAGTYVVTRLGLFALAAILTSAFLALVPGRATVFTALGAVTLYPYLLHGLFVKTVEGSGGYDVVAAGGLPSAALLTVLAGVLAVLLGSAPVRRAAGPFVEPRLPKWLWSPEETPPRAAPGASEPAPSRQSAR